MSQIVPAVFFLMSWYAWCSIWYIVCNLQIINPSLPDPGQREKKLT